MSSIFDIINIPMGYVLKFCDMIGGNYLIALLFFSIVVELLLLPFSIKQQKNSIKQAKLRPKEMAIRKKYAGRNDQVTQRKVQEEIMELYQKENYNPASGCLPLVIQFPILIALYNIVMNPLRYVCGVSKDITAAIAEVFKSEAVKEFFAGIEGYVLPDAARMSSQDIQMIEPIKKLLDTTVNTAGVGIEELRATGFDLIAEDLPNFNLFGAINLAEIPTVAINWLILVPILTFVCSLFSTKIIRKFTYQPTTSEAQQNNISMKIMEYSMPLMSVWICFMVPAAIGVYWMFKQLLGMIKQIILAKVMPTPKFTDEDYKAAEREYAGKQKAKKSSEKDPNRPKVRSLHHIDDEDFDDTRKAPVEPEKKVEEAKEEAPAIVDKAPLKDESDRHQK